MSKPTPQEIDEFVEYFEKIEMLAITSGLECAELESVLNVLTYLDEVKYTEEMYASS